MSHIVAMSNANGPDAGQNGLSSGAKHGLTSEWYSAVANTVRRSLDAVSTRIVSRCSDHAALVAARRESKAWVPSPQSARRFRRACSTPRSENPNRNSIDWPGSVGPRSSRPNGRSVVGRIESKSSWVPPGIRRWSYQSIWRHVGVSHSRWTASGAPSTTISPLATPGSEHAQARPRRHGPAVLDRQPTE
jgi:hypothetical protein